MLRHNFSRPDGRLVKLSLFSTALDKSLLTYIYFITFEKKRKVRSPLPRQSNFLVFGIFIYHYKFTKLLLKFHSFYRSVSAINMSLNCNLKDLRLSVPEKVWVAYPKYPTKSQTFCRRGCSHRVGVVIVGTFCTAPSVHNFTICVRRTRSTSGRIHDKPSRTRN